MPRDDRSAVGGGARAERGGDRSGRRLRRLLRDHEGERRRRRRALDSHVEEDVVPVPRELRHDRPLLELHLDGGDAGEEAARMKRVEELVREHTVLRLGEEVTAHLRPLQRREGVPANEARLKSGGGDRRESRGRRGGQCGSGGGGGNARAPPGGGRRARCAASRSRRPRGRSRAPAPAARRAPASCAASEGRSRGPRPSTTH